MKRLTLLVFALSLFSAGCDEVLAPAAPTGVVALASQASAGQVLPAVAAPETTAVGGVSISMTPAGSGNYTASFTMQLSGFVKAGVTPLLPDGSVIVAGVIYQGAAGAVGAPVLQLPIGATTAVPPVYTPTGTALITLSNVAVPSAVASAILANPSGFYFQLHSALNQAGVVRGQLIKQ
jgi:hypothetical protein